MLLVGQQLDFVFERKPSALAAEGTDAQCPWTQLGCCHRALDGQGTVSRRQALRGGMTDEDEPDAQFTVAVEDFGGAWAHVAQVLDVCACCQPACGVAHA